MEEMIRLIDILRKDSPGEINGIRVTEVRDYMDYHGPIVLPKENVLQFILEDSSWFCVRPSGTEPKLKIYFSVIGENSLGAEAAMEGLRACVSELVRTAPTVS
jgi:phosphoglucomutase